MGNNIHIGFDPANFNPEIHAHGQNISKDFVAKLFNDKANLPVVFIACRMNNCGKNTRWHKRLQKLETQGVLASYWGKFIAILGHRLGWLAVTVEEFQAGIKKYEITPTIGDYWCEEEPIYFERSGDICIGLFDPKTSKIYYVLPTEPIIKKSKDGRFLVVIGAPFMVVNDEGRPFEIAKDRTMPVLRLVSQQ